MFFQDCVQYMYVIIYNRNRVPYIDISATTLTNLIISHVQYK